LYLTPSKLETLKKLLVRGIPKTDILAILGDVAYHGSEAPEFREGISLLSNTARHVLFILGNREQFSTYEPMAGYYYAQNALNGLKNVTILNQSSITLYGIRYVGCTLWTDTTRFKPNDSGKWLFPTPSRVPPNLTKWDNLDAEHIRDINYLNRVLQDHPNVPTIILTHHSPIMNSNNDDEPLYSSDLTDLISKYRHQIYLWGHGHIRSRQYRYLHGVPIICNPWIQNTFRDCLIPIT